MEPLGTDPQKKQNDFSPATGYGNATGSATTGRTTGDGSSSFTMGNATGDATTGRTTGQGVSNPYGQQPGTVTGGALGSRPGTNMSGSTYANPLGTGSGAPSQPPAFIQPVTQPQAPTTVQNVAQPVTEPSTQPAPQEPQMAQRTAEGNAVIPDWMKGEDGKIDSSWSINPDSGTAGIQAVLNTSANNRDAGVAQYQTMKSIADSPEARTKLASQIGAEQEGEGSTTKQRMAQLNSYINPLG